MLKVEMLGEVELQKLKFPRFVGIPNFSHDIKWIKQQVNFSLNLDSIVYSLIETENSKN